MNKLWSITDIATTVGVSNKTILNHCKKHNIISAMDKQGKTYYLNQSQLQRLLFICYPKVYGLLFDGLQEGSMDTNVQPVPTSVGKISRVTYKNKQGTITEYYRIVKFPLRYNPDGSLQYYKTQSFKTKEEAVLCRQQLIHRRQHGEFTPTQQQSFYDICTDIFRHRRYKKNTRDSIDRTLRLYFKPYFKQYTLQTINRSVLQRFLDSCTSAKSIVSSMLHTVLKELWIDDRIPKDYGSQLYVEKSAHKIKQPLTESQLQQYYELVEKKPLAFLCRLMFCSGLRINEALALEWTDINYLDEAVFSVSVSKNLMYDFETKEFITDTPKTPSSVRTVYVNNQSLLQELQEKQKNAVSKYLGYNPKTRKREYSTLFNRKYFYNIGKKMGISLSSHYARVTYASHALENGLTIKNLQQQLGHSDSMMLHKIYAKPVGSIVDNVRNTQLPF